MLTEEQLRETFERRHATRFSRYSFNLEQVFARDADGKYESKLLQQAWELFQSATSRLLSLLPDQPGQFEPTLARRFRDMCVTLDVPDLPESDEALWVKAPAILEQIMKVPSK